MLLFLDLQKCHFHMIPPNRTNGNHYIGWLGCLLIGGDPQSLSWCTCALQGTAEGGGLPSPPSWGPAL